MSLAIHNLARVRRAVIVSHVLIFLSIPPIATSGTIATWNTRNNVLGSLGTTGLSCTTGTDIRLGVEARCRKRLNAHHLRARKGLAGDRGTHLVFQVRTPA